MELERVIRIVVSAVLTALVLCLVYSMCTTWDYRNTCPPFLGLFVKLLGRWGWHPTHIGFLNFLIGVVHVFAYVILGLLGIGLDIVLILLPFVTGCIIGLLFLIFSWGSGKAFEVGVYLTSIVWDSFVVFCVLYFWILPFILSSLGSFFEYLVGFLGSRSNKYQVLKGTSKSSSDIAKKREVMVLNKKRRELEDKQDTILSQIANYQVLYPEILDEGEISDGVLGLLTDPNLKPVYDGYIAEASKRFAMKQQIKTMKVRSEALSELKRLCEELTEVHRAIAKLSEAAYESEVARIRNEIRGRRLRSGQVEKEIEREEELRSKRIDKEIELTDLERKARIEELETRIAKARIARENIERKKDEREDTIEDIVNKVKMQAISIVKAKEEIREMFADNPELVEAMLDRFERELVEKGISGGD